MPASPSTWVSKTSSAINGDAPVDSGGGGNRVEGNALALIPAEGDDLAYALYTQDGITADKPVSVQFTVEPTKLIPAEGDDLAMEFWIGLSDYTTFRWEWLGPYNSASVSSLRRGSVMTKGTSSLFSLPLNSATLRERYISKPDAAQDCRFSYVVLVTATGDPNQPHAVKIDTSQTNLSATYFPNKPHFVPVFDPVVQQDFAKQADAAIKRASSSCNLGWEDINALWTSDLPDEAKNYKILRRSEGQTVGQQLTQLPGSSSSWQDSNPIPGTRCTYYLVAVNDAGETAPSALPPVDFDIRPPDELHTDISVSPAGIRLTWTAPAGAVSYDVYAQYASDSFPTLMSAKRKTTTFTHTIPTLQVGQWVNYTVVARGESVISKPSAGIRGFYPDYSEGGTTPGLVTLVLNPATSPATDLRFLHVPAGDLQLGSPDAESNRDSSFEDGYQTVSMNEYYVMDREVTNAMWAEFMADGGYARAADIWSDGGEAWRDDLTSHGTIDRPPHWGDTAFNSDPVSQPDAPVLDISWYEAVAFANWANEKYGNLGSPPLQGASLALPAEPEWEYAAEGPTAVDELWLYPWCEMGRLAGGELNNGNDGQDMARCNSADNPALDPFIDTSSPVTSFLLGRSWCGAYDMAGNAAEWTRNAFDFGSYPDPWVDQSVDGADSSSFAVARGGRFLDADSALRTSARAGFSLAFREEPGYAWEGVGLRLVLIP